MIIIPTIEISGSIFLNSYMWNHSGERIPCIDTPIDTVRPSRITCGDHQIEGHRDAPLRTQGLRP